MSIYNGIFGNKGNVSLKICKPVNLDKDINFDSIAEIIDKEISNIVETQFKRAISLLKKHKNKLTELANYLLEKEVIFKEDLVRIFGERPFQEIKIEK